MYRHTQIGWLMILVCGVVLLTLIPSLGGGSREGAWLPLLLCLVLLALFCTLMTSLGRGFGKAGGDQPGALRAMVKGEDPVIETHREIGDFKLIETGSRQPLKMMAEIVAEQPSSATLKQGQPGKRLRGVACQLFRKNHEGIGRLPEPSLARQPSSGSPRP